MDLPFKIGNLTSLLGESSHIVLLWSNQKTIEAFQTAGGLRIWPSGPKPHQCPVPMPVILEEVG